MPDKTSRYDLQTTNLEHPEVRKPRTRTLRSDIVFTFALGIGLTIAWELRHEIALLYVSALFAVVLMPVLRGVQKIKIGKWSPGAAKSELFATLPEGSVGNAIRFTPEELSGPAELRLYLATATSVEVHVPGRDPVHGTGIDRRQAVTP